MPTALRLARASLVLIALVLVPANAGAVQGMNLRWNKCFGDGGVQNQAFACNTNQGVQTLVGSFVLASDMADVIGTEIILQLAADSPALPAWWQFRHVGDCRQPALNALFFAPVGSVACVDWAGDLAVGGIGGYCTTASPCITPPPGANAAVIKAISAVAMADARPLLGGVEYFDFILNISNTKTVGTGACAGCTVPVCIVLNSIRVVDNAEQHPRFISTPATPGSNFATWQGGGNPSVGGIVGCPAATPTRRTSWGSMKSLYR